MIKKIFAIILLCTFGLTFAAASSNTSQQVQFIQLTTSAEDDFFGSWSPDGEKIVFSSINYSTLSTEIWIINSDGGNKVQLFNNTRACMKACRVSVGGFSPDGTKIDVWVGYIDENGKALNLSIWVMNNDGSNPVQLTTSGLNIGPKWSPDGKKIVFIVLSSIPGRRDIWVMNSDGTNKVSLTMDLGDASSEFWTAQWSPDGKKIVFSSNISGREDIWIMNSDGSKKKKLSKNEGLSHYVSPAWSPSGEKIAFRSDHGDLWIMDKDGSRKSLLAEKISDYSFSPDGTKIAYSDWNNIGIMSSDGSNKTQLITEREFKEFNFGPIWSPDGKKIAFTSSRDGNLDIWVMALGKEIASTAVSTTAVAAVPTPILRTPAFEAIVALLVFFAAFLFMPPNQSVTHVPHRTCPHL
ncbi:hypothetical protein KKH23_05255 [Patescibacteria group bacterium]|nr:hypothetical protein [Patescibacteria group bacterium]